MVQNYDLFNHVLDDLTARFLPWLEFMAGIFLVIGLWMKAALRFLWVLTAVFIFVVGQAILRNLPIKECGCFGSLWPIPLWMTLIVDSALLVALAALVVLLRRIYFLSLDRYFLMRR